MDVDRINQDTWCVMAHRGFFVQPDKSIKPCCVFKKFDKPLYYDSSKTFDELFNSPQFVDLRQKLASGIKYEGCSDCWSGRTSHREGMNRMYSYPEYKFTPSLYEKDIFYLDLRLGNLCNFKCRMCNPTYSSAWGDEVKKYDLPITLEPTDKLVKGDWLSPLIGNLDKIQHVYLGGGEPLIMKETYELLDCLDSRKEHIQLFINTNLSTLKFKDINILEKFYKFKSVYWFLSCDGTGSAGSYQRTGFNTQKFYKNLDKILSLPKEKTKYNIAYALTNVNVFEFFQTYTDLKQRTGNDDLELNIQVVDDPWYYSVKNNSSQFKERVLNYINQNSKIITNQHTLQTLKNFKAFIVQDSFLPPVSKIKKDLQTLKRIDSIRQENLFDIAPWMIDEIKIWENTLKS